MKQQLPEQPLKTHWLKNDKKDINDKHDKPSGERLNKTEKKRLREQKVVGEMIALYCRKNHPDRECADRECGTKSGIRKDSYTFKNDYKSHGMCSECRQLYEYASERSRRCPFMEKKTFCSNCTVHCYRPEMRERIRTVMRFAGPRMLLYHPLMAIWHLVSSRLEKVRSKKKA